MVQGVWLGISKLCPVKKNIASDAKSINRDSEQHTSVGGFSNMKRFETTFECLAVSTYVRG